MLRGILASCGSLARISLIDFWTMATVSPPFEAAPTPQTINSQPGARETSVRTRALASRMALLGILAARRGGKHRNRGGCNAARGFWGCQIDRRGRAWIRVPRHQRD